MLSAGAIFAEDEQTIIGGCIVFRANSIEEARNIVNKDPYMLHPKIGLNTQVVPYRIRWKDGKFLDGLEY